MNNESFDQNAAGKVAIYWDFENFHATLADQRHGQGAYRENAFTTQPRFFEIEPVIEYAASYGDVIINKAYSNWQWFANYRHMLNAAGVDLIQFFPRGKNMKNSADIRLALDVLSDIHSYPHITHVVVVSSDSDFISLAQKVKQAGKFIAGVGVSGSSNRFWVASCNEFKFYHSLVGAADPLLSQNRPSTTDTGAGGGRESEPASPWETARGALRRAMSGLIERSGENRVANAGLKSVMKQVMPTFDENALGCETFTVFLLKCSDIVRMVDHTHGGHVALIDSGTPGLPPGTTTAPGDQGSRSATDSSGAGDWTDNGGQTDSPGRGETGSAPTLQQSRGVLQRAMLQLIERRGENRINKAPLKSIMRRLMPSFDERALGFGNFSDFILQCQDVVRVLDEINGGHVALLDFSGITPGSEDPAPPSPETDLETDPESPSPSWDVPGYAVPVSGNGDTVNTEEAPPERGDDFFYPGVPDQTVTTSTAEGDPFLPNAPHWPTYDRLDKPEGEHP